MRTSTNKILFALGLLSALAAAGIPLLVLDRFIQTLQSLDNEIPVITQLYLRYHQFIWILPILILAIWLIWPKSSKSAMFSCLLGAFGMIAVALSMIIYV